MRNNNWIIKLHEIVDAAQNKDFQYGTFDCALFAADCVNAITGIDYAAELRGYQSKIDAYRIVAEYGSLEAMITSLLKKEPIHPAWAQHGDVVLGNPPVMAGESGDAIGICLGMKFAFPKEKGLATYGIESCKLAWRIE